ncbi:hypothetical protein NKH80_02265 [Mesorhizobium sp. M0904]|uniref:hypothetical protein n=1 Tax=Mesorhizobium sp. M0904 TaxID=2957022 RepID=UPI00333A798F
MPQDPKAPPEPLHERQGVRPLIAAARAVHALNQGDSLVSFQGRPNLVFENGLNLDLVGQGIEERLDEAQSHLTTFRNEFQRGDVYIVGSNLTVPDYPVAGELKSGYTKMRKAHHRGFLIV